MPTSPKPKRSAGAATAVSEVYLHAKAIMAERHSRRGGSRYRLLGDYSHDVDPSRGPLDRFDRLEPVEVYDWCVPKSKRVAVTGTRNATGRMLRVYPDGRVEAVEGSEAADLTGVVSRRQRRDMERRT